MWWVKKRHRREKIADDIVAVIGQSCLQNRTIARISNEKMAAVILRALHDQRRSLTLSPRMLEPRN